MRRVSVLVAVVMVLGWGAFRTAEAAPFVYTTSFQAQAASVIDVATSAVSATIPLGAAPTGILATPDGSKVYVSTSAGVKVISTASNTVTATIAGSPIGMALSADGTRLYLSQSSFTPPGPPVLGLTVVETTGDTVLSTISLTSVSSNIAAGAADRLYMAASSGQSSGSLIVINPLTGATVGTVALTGSPAGLAVSPDGSRVYVGLTTSFQPLATNVTVVGTPANVVTGTIATSGFVGGLAVSPDGTKLYVSEIVSSGSSSSGSINVVNTATNASIATISLTGTASNIVLSGDGRSLFAVASTDSSSGTSTSSVVVIDTTTNAVTSTIPLSGSASYVAVVGAAAGPTVAVTPTSVDFCATTVGATVDRTITVRNSGSGTLTGTVTAQAPFSIVSGGTLGVAAGGSQAVVVRFTPFGAITSTGNVSISSSGGTASVALTGTAYAALPTVQLTLSGTSFRTGQILTIGLNAQTAAGAPLSDLYTGALMPDGRTVLFVTAPGVLGGAAILSNPGQFVHTTLNAQSSATYFSFTFPATVPSGTYRIVAAYARQGSLADNRLDTCDLLATDLKTLTFAP